MDTLIRWTIGPVQPAGFDCLRLSVRAFQKIYPSAKIVICHNGLSPSQHEAVQVIGVPLFDQKIAKIEWREIEPIGVAWKLYPPRLDLNAHEIFIDNDLILHDRLPEIDKFLAGDLTLLMEADARHYGAFERHVPAGYRINSGLFGVPPGFDLARYLRFYVRQWENNCEHQSATWDEQGFVALALLSYKQFVVIPETTVINCENRFSWASGVHFVGLNRRPFHRPFAEYKTCGKKMYL